jgi:hypothetical protein
MTMKISRSKATGIGLTLVPVLLAIFLSACGSMSAGDSKAHILVVDGRGGPIRGALVLPEDETESGSRHEYTEYEKAERSTDAQGNLRLDLGDYYWASDGCYHFRVTRRGYEAETMAVSKDLFPGVLKVDMRPREPDANPTPPRP